MSPCVYLNLNLELCIRDRIGEVYRGKLLEAEDNMNCQLSSVTVTTRDGRTAAVENVFLRGSKIRYSPFRVSNSFFALHNYFQCATMHVH